MLAAFVLLAFLAGLGVQRWRETLAPATLTTAPIR